MAPRKMMVSACRQSFMAKLRQDHPHLQFIVTEDGLSANAPHIETLHDYACHSILGLVKEGERMSKTVQCDRDPPMAADRAAHG